MREKIKKLLEQCTNCNFSNYDEATKTYHIPKYSKPQYRLNNCYLIKVSRAILQNPNSVTAVNWNNSYAPQFEYLKIYISKILGKMIYCDCAGYDFENKKDINYVWSGWLNIDEIEQIMAL